MSIVRSSFCWSVRDLGFPGLAELAAEAGANGADDGRRLTGRRADRGAALALRRGGEDGRGADSRWTLRLRRLPVRRLRLQPLALAGEAGQAHRDDLGRRRNRAAQALRDPRARTILLFRLRAPARGVRLEATGADRWPPAAGKGGVARRPRRAPTRPRPRRRPRRRAREALPDRRDLPQRQ